MNTIEELEKRLKAAEDRIKKDESFLKQIKSIPNLVAVLALSLTLFQLIGGYIEGKEFEVEMNESELRDDISMLLSDVSMYESTRNRTASDSIAIKQQLITLEGKATIRQTDAELFSAIGIGYKAINNLSKSRKYLNRAIELALTNNDIDSATNLSSELLVVEIWNASKESVSNVELGKSLKKAEYILSLLKEPYKSSFRQSVVVRSRIQICLLSEDQDCVTPLLESISREEKYDPNFIYQTLKSIRLKFGEKLGNVNQELFEKIVDSFEEKSGARSNSKLLDLLDS